ncbi:MAG: response regulator transcription factor [Spirosomaceae bacterium]|nr:response regulator transcription factor [Spirosomataceae bacterium]
MNIILIDDDTYFLKKASNLLERHGHTVDFTAISVADALKKLNKKSVTDLIFLDIIMPDIDGFEGIKYLRKALPEAQIVMCSVVENEESLFKAITLGASGYIIKSDPLESITESVDTIEKGGAGISPKMSRYLINYFKPINNGVEKVLSKKNLLVLHLISEGWTYKLIAEKLDMTIDGVRAHIKVIYKKLGVNSAPHAVRKYLTNQL